MNMESPRAKKKYEQILDGATEIFEQQGFDCSSVDMIAETADVSKATLYKYFPNKQELFKAVIARHCEKVVDQAVKLQDVNGTLEEDLLLMATSVARAITQKSLIDLLRLSIAEANKFPDVARTFYKAGPVAGVDVIAAVLQKHVDSGDLNIDDVKLAAHQFHGLCQSKMFHRALLGIQEKFSNAEIEQNSKDSVEMFLKAYGKN